MNRRYGWHDIIAVSSLSIAIFAFVYTIVVSDYSRKCDNLYRNYISLATLGTAISSTIVDVTSQIGILSDEPIDESIVTHGMSMVIRPAQLFGFDTKGITSAIVGLFIFGALDLAPFSSLPFDPREGLRTYRGELEKLDSQVHKRVVELIDINRLQCGSLIAH